MMRSPISIGSEERVAEDRDQRYVSRGGTKLAHALDEFGVNPTGWTCADLGSHVGGFVDCLLDRGAARVYAVDTCYGTLAWKLRKDPRVVVMERTNALHVQLPEPVDLVTLDVGWTRQSLILPRAQSLLCQNPSRDRERAVLPPSNRMGPLIITLIKPHYEAESQYLRDGVLDPAHFDDVVQRVFQQIADIGIDVLATTPSPITSHAGNRELLALLSPQK